MSSGRDLTVARFNTRRINRYSVHRTSRVRFRAYTAPGAAIRMSLARATCTSRSWD